MASLNVNMPKGLRAFVDRRTSEGGFGTPTEYVRHLIRQDREAAAQRSLEAKLLRAMRSGNARGNVSDFFKRLHKRVDEIEARHRAPRPRPRGAK